jgi:hypothetical protein
MKTIEIQSGLIPFIIVNRDRTTDLKELLNWVYNVNTVPVKVIIIDNNSSYRPLIEYYNQIREKYKNLQIVQIQFNGGVRVIEQFQLLGGLQHYIYTETDVVPDENCPPDLILKLIELSNKYPRVHKIGLSLRIDDIPNEFPFKDDILRIETINRSIKTPDGDAYIAEVNSTFALYKKGFSDFKVRIRNIRTLEPLCARHRFYYYTPNNMPDDVSYYITRCSNESVIGKKFLTLLKNSGKIVAPVRISNLNPKIVPKRLEDQNDLDFTIDDSCYNKIVVGKSYDYRTQNGQSLVITFNNDFTVTGSGGVVGKFYMAEYRAVIEWSNCLNNTVDIIDFTNDLERFTGTSIDNGNVSGVLKKIQPEVSNIEPVVFEIETADKPIEVQEPSPNLKLEPPVNVKVSILIFGCNLPTFRKLDFLDWNKQLFESDKDVVVHIITDMPDRLPKYDWLDIITFLSPTSEYITKSALNYGLKNISNSDIIVKADIDTLFTKDILDNIKKFVSRGKGLVCHYSQLDNINQIAKTIDEWLAMEKSKTNSFCFAMHKDDWYFLRGYDDRFSSSNSDDENLYIKAKSKIAIFESDQCPLYKISISNRVSLNKVLSVNGRRRRSDGP